MPHTAADAPPPPSQMRSGPPAHAPPESLHGGRSGRVSGERGVAALTARETRERLCGVPPDVHIPPSTQAYTRASVVLREYRGVPRACFPTRAVSSNYTRPQPKPQLRHPNRQLSSRAVSNQALLAQPCHAGSVIPPPVLMSPSSFQTIIRMQVREQLAGEENPARRTKVAALTSRSGRPPS